MIARSAIFWIPTLTLLLGCETPAPIGGPPMPTLPTGNLTTPAHPSLGEIERLDPALDQLIAREAVIEQLADGFDWAEGPVWVQSAQGEGFVLFSDIPPNKIYKWSEANGLEDYLQPSGYTGTTLRAGEPGSNGLLLDAQGRLVLCQHGDRRIARLTTPLNAPQPIYQTVIGAYQGKRFNSPNDGCFDRQGNLYFTDPPYGLEKRLSDPAKELSFQGVYLFTKGGDLKLLTDKIAFPNGIAL